MDSLKTLKTFVLAVFTLSGAIIGVGLFSLPYITSKVGLGVMLGYFLILGFLTIVIHLFFGEVVLKTPDFKRVPGFAKFHLGKRGERVAFVSTILGTFGAILAYLIVGGEFLTGLLTPFFGGNALIYTLLYFIAGALLIFLGMRIIAKIEFWGLVLFLVALALIYWNAKDLINIGNLSSSFGNWKLEIGNWFLPYGPILFSLSGASLIPEIEEMLGGKKRLLKKVILTAVSLPIAVYLFFIFFILGITGQKTTESALTGLANFLGPGLSSLGLMLGVLATFTSFIALGLYLKNVFRYDLKMNKNFAWALACFLPLALFLIGIKSFIPVISFVGGIMLGIEGILILLMYKKINPRDIFVYPLSLIFLGGIIYEIIYFIK